MKSYNIDKIKLIMGNIDDIQIYVYDSTTRVFEIFKHKNQYVHIWLAQFNWDLWVHLHSHARDMKWIKDIQINSCLQLEINLPIPCDFIGNKRSNGAEQKAESHSRSIEHVRIFNCWVDSN